MLDPEIKKLLEKLDPEDLRDLAALHGAGSFERQSKAHMKQTAAELSVLVYPILVMVSALVAIPVVGFIVLVLLSLFGVHVQWS